MRLGTRLTLAFLAVALIPAGAILTLTWWSVEARFEDEFQERTQGVASGLRAELDRIGQRLQDKVRALTETEEVERILVDMVRGSLDRRGLIGAAAKWMRAWDLDLLTVMDDQGVVLSSGHLPARFGHRDEELLALASQEGMHPRVQTVQMSQSGMIHERLAVVVGAVRRFNEAEIVLAGGRLIDEDFVVQLETLSGAAIAVVDQLNRIIAAGRLNRDETLETLPEPSDPRWQRVVLGQSLGGAMSVQLAARVPRDRLESAQRSILFGAAAAAVAGVVFSWMFGLLLSRRITRPVHALVEVARHVATGDLEHRVAGKHGAEVGELVQTFNTMVADLASYQGRLVRAERVAAWREIARRIAHEIKNPLSPIQVSIETMRKTYASDHPDFPEIFEESTQAILEEVAALKRIVTEFSDFARMPKPTPISQALNPVIEAAVNLFRAQVQQGRLRFESAIGLPEVQVDREQIGQVLHNLLSNALHAIGERGNVLVRTGLRAGSVFFQVEDTGAGMSSEVLAKVFTPYFTTRQDGTGLGLAIVQRIVEDHGGAIEIESSTGVGTTVTVILPT